MIIEEQKAKKGVKNDTDLTTDDLKELVKNFKAAVKKQTGEDFRPVRGTSCGEPSAPCSDRG